MLLQELVGGGVDDGQIGVEPKEAQHEDAEQDAVDYERDCDWLAFEAFEDTGAIGQNNGAHIDRQDDSGGEAHQKEIEISAVMRWPYR